MSDYFPLWNEETKDGRISLGWRNDQIRYFRTYIEPVIGSLKLQKVTPIHVKRVLRQMYDSGLSKQMQLHIYNLMHKLFGDAIELFNYLSQSPVLKKERPKPEKKESPHLSVPEARRLVEAVRGTSIEAAVWLQLYAGLRAGEVQALRWNHVDFERGTLLVSGTYVRKERRFKDVPKGGEEHRIHLPPELRDYLVALRGRSNSNYVASNHPSAFLNYQSYYNALRRACKRAGVPQVGTHGLRHSTSEIYLEHGASFDDVGKLFAHSTESVTKRYIHDRGSRLEGVAKVIRLFPEASAPGEGSQKFPKSEEAGS